MYRNEIYNINRKHNKNKLDPFGIILLYKRINYYRIRWILPPPVMVPSAIFSGGRIQLALQWDQTLCQMNVNYKIICKILNHNIINSRLLKTVQLSSLK